MRRSFSSIVSSRNSPILSPGSAQSGSYACYTAARIRKAGYSSSHRYCNPFFFYATLPIFLVERAYTLLSVGALTLDLHLRGQYAQSGPRYSRTDFTIRYDRR